MNRVIGVKEVHQATFSSSHPGAWIMTGSNSPTDDRWVFRSVEWECVIEFWGMAIGPDVSFIEFGLFLFVPCLIIHSNSHKFWLAMGTKNRDVWHNKQHAMIPFDNGTNFLQMIDLPTCHVLIENLWESTSLLFVAFKVFLPNTVSNFVRIPLLPLFGIADTPLEANMESEHRPFGHLHFWSPLLSGV